MSNISCSSRSSLVLVTGLVLLAGCASPAGKFTAKKDPAYVGKLERVLVIHNNDQGSAAALGRHFSEKLLARLSASLAGRGVVTEVVRPDENSVDRNAPVRAAQARFHSSHALQFGLAGVETRVRVNELQFGMIGAESHLQGKQPQISRPPPVTRETSVLFEFSLTDTPRDQVVWRGQMGYYVIPEPEAVADQFVEQLGAEHFLSGPASTSP